MPNTLTTTEVFDMLAAERQRQVGIWGDLDDYNNVADFLVYIERYWNTAVNSNNPQDPAGSLEAIKKLTALGVACLEKFGAPPQRVKIVSNPN